MSANKSIMRLQVWMLDLAVANFYRRSYIWVFMPVALLSCDSYALVKQIVGSDAEAHFGMVELLT
jgi:hypothetical protein